MTSRTHAPSVRTLAATSEESAPEMPLHTALLGFPSPELRPHRPREARAGPDAASLRREEGGKD